MFYGKHFGSMYDGSMVGAGTHVFAVMGYVIAKTQPDKELGGVVRLNANLLAATLGDSVERIQQAIDYLCGPDPISTTPGDDGRRLVKVGQFDYRVVNYAKYFAIQSEEHRREANRERQARHREKVKGHTTKAQQKRNEARRATELDKAKKTQFLIASDKHEPAKT